MKRILHFILEYFIYKFEMIQNIIKETELCSRRETLISAKMDSRQGLIKEESSSTMRKAIANFNFPTRVPLAPTATKSACDGRNPE